MQTSNTLFSRSMYIIDENGFLTAMQIGSKFDLLEFVMYSTVASMKVLYIST